VDAVCNSTGASSLIAKLNITVRMGSIAPLILFCEFMGTSPRYTHRHKSRFVTFLVVGM
jgi:hypothetical protein